MEKLKGTLIRLKDNSSKQTLGNLYIHDGLKMVFSCATLELEDFDNKTNISRIPAGKYIVETRWSKAHGNHFHITDVHGRSYILIHSGNYYTQIRGCVLVGTSFTDINGDGEQDVIWSKHTMKKLREAAPNGFELTIIDE